MYIRLKNKNFSKKVNDFLEKNKNLRGKDKYIENFKFKYLKFKIYLRPIM